MLRGDCLSLPGQPWCGGPAPSPRRHDSPALSRPCRCSPKPPPVHPSNVQSAVLRRPPSVAVLVLSSSIVNHSSRCRHSCRRHCRLSSVAVNTVVIVVVVVVVVVLPQGDVWEGRGLNSPPRATRPPAAHRISNTPRETEGPFRSAKASLQQVLNISSSLFAY